MFNTDWIFRMMWILRSRSNFEIRFWNFKKFSVFTNLTIGVKMFLGWFCKLQLLKAALNCFHSLRVWKSLLHRYQAFCGDLRHFKCSGIKKHWVCGNFEDSSFSCNQKVFFESFNNFTEILILKIEINSIYIKCKWDFRNSCSNKFKFQWKSHLIWSLSGCCGWHISWIRHMGC